MAKVYVVVKWTLEDSQDRYFHKVFGTKEKAEKFVNSQYEEEDFEILEEEINLK